ncbi:MAG: family 10 glycosylhydrolase [Cyanobacteria bacterium J06621_11]
MSPSIPSKSDVSQLNVSQSNGSSSTSQPVQSESVVSASGTTESVVPAVTQATVRNPISVSPSFPFSVSSFLGEPVYAADAATAIQLSSDTVNADVDLFQPLLENPSETPQSLARTISLWESKEIRGIYMSRYRITNNTDEETIRNRVRYYKEQGINTIIHGVWGNGCPMYDSGVMQKTFGLSRCDNEFQAQWLDWLLDEAHAQGLQVHAYFEKGIKLDANSPIFEVARENGWFVPGIDRTYPNIDHYVLDVENPHVSQFFEQILAEFVQKYPTIDAVQWDDYLGYHAGLSDQVDRTSHLTSFVQRMRTGMKAANPDVSFDICHHNPYWGARYFAADWENWGADRAFIQAYNDANFNDELSYIESSAGVAISDNQLHRLGDIINNPNIKSVLIFPTTGDPVTAAQRVNAAITGR